MVQRSAVPFNVKILEVTPQKLVGLQPVRSLDIFDNAQNLHDSGLFSTTIFGKVGDDRRSQRFSYIDIKISVFHPVIHRALVAIKRLYGDIMSGKEYAVWNEETKDFDRSNMIDGQTGFHFFVSKWEDLEFVENKSTSREQNILLVKKYMKVALTSKIIVMPAGMRDVEIDDAGRVSMDEINGYYKSLLGIANTVSDSALRTNPELLNRARYRLQASFIDLYNHIEGMIQGKKKFLLGSWASRSPMNGTRNVITAMDTNTDILGSPGSIRMNDTVIGLFQSLKAYMPVARYHIRNTYLPLVFNTADTPANLVDMKTWKKTSVVLPPSYFDRYMTNEGVEKIITAFGEESIRHKPMILEGHFLGLVYKGPDGTFKFMQDIDDLPEGRSKNHVYPITFCEFLYMSCYKMLSKFPLFVTRYPITGVGSIYPSYAYTRTTIAKEVREELNESWLPSGDKAYNFPVRDASFVNSLVPHSFKVSGLNADYDGDMCSGNGTYSDESLAEIDRFLSLKKAYVGTNGKFISSTNITTVSLLLHNLTGEPVPETVA